MSKTTMALIWKFIITLVAAYITLTLIGRATIGQVIVIAVIGTAVNYLLGDLVILKATSNIVAAICDGILAGIVAIVVMYIWRGTTLNYWSVLIFAIIVAIAEYFFHNYLRRSEEVAP